MTDVEHKPHSFYIDRYPVGREATVAWPTVDLQWRNDTPYGVLVHAHVTPSTPSAQGVVTVRLFSTKYWDITTKTGERYNFTSPATRTLDTPDCYPNTGYGGFDINIWRYWRRAGSDELERTEKMHTTYIPSDTVICKPPGRSRLTSRVRRRPDALEIPMGLLTEDPVPPGFTGTRIGVCNLCEAICGIELTITDGAVTGIRGNEADPLSRGYICPKGVSMADVLRRPRPAAPTRAPGRRGRRRDVGGARLGRGVRPGRRPARRDDHRARRRRRRHLPRQPQRALARVR